MNFRGILNFNLEKILRSLAVLQFSYTQLYSHTQLSGPVVLLTSHTPHTYMIRMILMTSLLMHVAKAFTKPYTNRSLGLILHRLVSTHNKSPKNDYIDVEIVNDDENSKKKAVSTKPIPTFFDSATYEKKSIEKKEEKKGIFSGIARFFGLDEKSQRKRKQRQEVNTAIDKVFQGTLLHFTSLYFTLLKRALPFITALHYKFPYTLRALYEPSTRTLLPP